jgi:hypothetical protein
VIISWSLIFGEWRSRRRCAIRRDALTHEVGGAGLLGGQVGDREDGDGGFFPVLRSVT